MNTKNILEADTANALNDATNSRTQFANFADRKIAYRVIGKGDPLILCLRFRGNLDDWDPAFLDALATSFCVITFDYSGFGSSTGNPPQDLMGFANDVRDLASFLGYSRIIAGGWSFGGAVAQLCTSEFPDLVGQTILLGTRPPGSFNHPPEQIFLQTSAKPVNDLDDEMILFFEPQSSGSRRAAKLSHDRIAARSIDRDKYIPPELWEYYFKAFEDFAKDPYQSRQQLMKTTTPILVISADHEVVFPPQNWFELVRQLPTVQLIVIPQAGHGPHHQHPDLVANYIKAFVSNNKMPF